MQMMSDPSVLQNAAGMMSRMQGAPAQGTMGGGSFPVPGEGGVAGGAGA